MDQARAAVGMRIAQHIQEKGVKDIQPEILQAMGMAQKPDAAE
jgi:limonene 1,2-monooxygenase